MLFVIEAMDKRGALDLRLKTRASHLEYLENLGDNLIFAGPFLDEEEKPNGSLVVIRAQNLEKAKEIAKNDPYNKAGLFESTSVRAWNWAINNKEGIK